MAMIALSYLSRFYVASEQKGHIIGGCLRKTQITHRECYTKG
jgi:hypothetical protein